MWLEPYPDTLLEGVIDAPRDPEARYEQTESISLAFVTALQVLPPRQLAVLLLRDVLGFHANEVAGMLDSTVESVNSALKRARASLQRRVPPTGERAPAPAPDSPAEQALVAKFVSAYESGDPDALVALLTDDVFLSMPPIPLEYQGRDVVSRLFASIFASGRRVDLVPTRANGQPAAVAVRAREAVHMAKGGSGNEKGGGCNAARGTAERWRADVGRPNGSAAAGSGDAGQASPWVADDPGRRLDDLFNFVHDPATMQVCTMVSGQTAVTASGSPVVADQDEAIALQATRKVNYDGSATDPATMSPCG